MASESSNSRYVPPGYSLFNPSSPLPRAYFIVQGTYTGDIWHCAAAQILSEYRHENPSTDNQYPFDFQPVTASISYGQRSSSAASSAADSPCMELGRPCFNYLRSIGVPRVLVETEVPKRNVYEAYNALTYEKIDALYTEQQAKTDDYDTLRTTYARSAISLEDRHQYRVDNKLLPYDVSTTILMQLVQYLGLAQSQQILARRLWDNGSATDSQQIKTLAMQKVETLKGLITKAKQSGSVDQVVLFNYRLSDKNKTYDSNRKLLDQVKDWAKENKTAVVIIATGLGKQKFKDVFQDDDIYFDIYDVQIHGTNYFPDKRIAACFWSLVAEQLQIGSQIVAASVAAKSAQRCVVGLVGGRSGSIDLPSFMGVKVISWDEPLLDDREYASKKGTQMPQLLRLLNQKPFTFVAFLVPEALKPVPRTPKGKGKRKLDEIDPLQEEIDDNEEKHPESESEREPMRYESLQPNSLRWFLQSTWPEKQPFPWSDLSADVVCTLPPNLSSLYFQWLY